MYNDDWDHPFFQEKIDYDGRDARTGRDVRLHTSPHYSDDYYRKERTVWGRASKGLEYSYSDRLVQWDRDGWRKACTVADDAELVAASANWYEKVLSVYWGCAITLVHVQAGHNWSSGYPYAIFGYRREEND